MVYNSSKYREIQVLNSRLWQYTSIYKKIQLKKYNNWHLTYELDALYRIFIMSKD